MRNTIVSTFVMLMAIVSATDYVMPPMKPINDTTVMRKFNSYQSAIEAKLGYYFEGNTPFFNAIEYSQKNASPKSVLFQILYDLGNTTTVKVQVVQSTKQDDTFKVLSVHMINNAVPTVAPVKNQTQTTFVNPHNNSIMNEYMQDTKAPHKTEYTENGWIKVTEDDDIDMLLLFDSYQGLVEQRTGVHEVFRALSYKKETTNGVILYTIKYYIGNGQTNIVEISQPPAYSNERPYLKRMVYPDPNGAMFTKVGMAASALLAVAYTLA